jgi:SAM-dependent methyltransferase
MDDSEIKMLETLESYHWWYVIRKDYLISWASGLPKGAHILDLGSATGGNTLLLQDLGFIVTSLEYSNVGVDIQLSKGISVLQGDARDLPFTDNFFDAVICLDVLEHIWEDVQVLEEIHRVLNVYGKFLITVPEDPKLWSSHDEAVNHVRRYSKKELSTKVEKAGLGYSRIWSSNILLRPFIATVRKFTKGSNAKPTNKIVNLCLLFVCRFEKSLKITFLPGVTLWIQGRKT